MTYIAAHYNLSKKIFDNFKKFFSAKQIDDLPSSDKK